MKKFLFFISLLSLFFFTACKSVPEQSDTFPEPELTTTEEDIISTRTADSDSITMLFTGDLMAHTVNYNISDFSKIYRDVKDEISTSDLVFANIESPLDQTKKISSYPNFNMSEAYIQAAINAGFNVFSLCNNHSNDQGLEGIKETIKTTKKLEQLNESQIFFSGLREIENSEFSYNYIEKNGWKIIFLPITELLNRPTCISHINFINPTKKDREEFISFVKKLKSERPADLFILSLHTAEPEYVRKVSKSQTDYYLQLLDAGVDIIWANHAHLIKDRLFVFNSKTGTQKLIMYGNGNVISGQRTKPDFESSYPNYERDNTGDGLMYEVTFKKRENLPPEIKSVSAKYITTYINTANEYVLKKLDESTIMYCTEVKRLNWAKYIERRINVNNSETKDLILWQ